PLRRRPRAARRPHPLPEIDRPDDADVPVTASAARSRSARIFTQGRPCREVRAACGFFPLFRSSSPLGKPLGTNHTPPIRRISLDPHGVPVAWILQKLGAGGRTGRIVNPGERSDMLGRKVYVLIASGGLLAASSTVVAQRWGREVEPRNGACFYEDADYGGEKIFLAGGPSPHPPPAPP